MCNGSPTPKVFSCKNPRFNPNKQLPFSITAYPPFLCPPPMVGVGLGNSCRSWTWCYHCQGTPCSCVTPTYSVGTYTPRPMEVKRRENGVPGELESKRGNGGLDGFPQASQSDFRPNCGTHRSNGTSWCGSCSLSSWQGEAQCGGFIFPQIL